MDTRKGTVNEPAEITPNVIAMQIALYKILFYFYFMRSSIGIPGTALHGDFVYTRNNGSNNDNIIMIRRPWLDYTATS